MDSDNHSGIIWSLACLIILTLSAVFLATLVDKKHGSSQARNNLLEAIATGERNLENLRSELELLNSKHINAEERAISKAADVGSNGSLALQIGSSVDDLQKRRAELKASIPKLQEEFKGYRDRYRNKAWRDAAGERIGDLLLKTGRQFEKVTINRVTSIGIEISHAEGIARIDSKDLSNEFMDRFQWDEEERSEAIEAERANRERITRELPKEQLQPVAGVDNISGDELEKIRSQIRLLQTKVMVLQSSIQTAESESRYASKRSVPGSLRTWAEQASLLKTDLIRTEALLGLAKEKLRTTDPSDPLLIQETR